MSTAKSSRFHVSFIPENVIKESKSNDKPQRLSVYETLPKVEHYQDLHTQDKRPSLSDLHESPYKEFLQKRRGIDEAEDLKRGISKGIKFGWIKGVMIRCSLNIWGVMLFLRLSWIVGQAGIGYASLIVLISVTVTMITSMSMSAICTNGEIKGGGAYFMISRSLGPEFGGAIGIIFSLANAIAVSMNVVGLSETVVALIKNQTGSLYGISPINWVRIVGCLAVIFLLGVALAGMEWESKAQIVFLFILIMSFVNYFVGSVLPPSNFKKSRGFAGYQSYLFRENFRPSFRGESFFSIFAIYFPSATGILAGANISGDLKDAQKAIPRGTFTAIFVTAISYLAMIWTIGSCGMREASGNVSQVAPPGAEVPFYARGSELRQCDDTKSCRFGLLYDFQFVALASGSAPIISAGIFSATLSSAMACLVGASKVFQALCRDKLFPGIHIFGYGNKKNDDPIRAYFLVFVIAIIFCILGDLNLIAPIISNFFLMAYALINYSCFHASHSKSIGFRPGFKYYNHWISLLGSFLCLAAMILIQWWAAIVTLVAVLCLYFYVQIKQPNVNWGSSAQAHIYKDALESVIKLNETEEHVKNYRPQILALTGDPRTRPSFIDFTNLFTKNISLLVCGQILIDPTENVSLVDKRPVYKVLAHKNIRAIYNTTTASNYRKGVCSLMELSGLGRLRPNIIIMGFKNKWISCQLKEIEDYFNSIHDAFDLRLGVGILKVREGLDFSALLFETATTDTPDLPHDPNLDDKGEEALHISTNRRYTLGGSNLNLEKGLVNSRLNLDTEDDYFSNENYIPNVRKTIYPSSLALAAGLNKPKEHGKSKYDSTNGKGNKSTENSSFSNKPKISRKFLDKKLHASQRRATDIEEFSTTPISSSKKRTPTRRNDPVSRIFAKFNPLLSILTKKGREDKEKADKENLQAIRLLKSSVVEVVEDGRGQRPKATVVDKVPSTENLTSEAAKTLITSCPVSHTSMQDEEYEDDVIQMPEATVIIRKPDDLAEAQLASIQNIDYLPSSPNPITAPLPAGGVSTTTTFLPLSKSTSLLKLQQGNNPSLTNRLTSFYNRPRHQRQQGSKNTVIDGRIITMANDTSMKDVLGNLGVKMNNLTRSLSSFTLNKPSRRIGLGSLAATQSTDRVSNISEKFNAKQSISSSRLLTNIETIEESNGPTTTSSAASIYPRTRKMGKSMSQPQISTLNERILDRKFDANQKSPVTRDVNNNIIGGSGGSLLGQNTPPKVSRGGEEGKEGDANVNNKHTKDEIPGQPAAKFDIGCGDLHNTTLNEEKIWVEKQDLPQIDPQLNNVVKSPRSYVQPGIQGFRMIIPRATSIFSKRKKINWREKPPVVRINDNGNYPPVLLGGNVNKWDKRDRSKQHMMATSTNNNNNDGYGGKGQYDDPESIIAVPKFRKKKLRSPKPKSRRKRWRGKTLSAFGGRVFTNDAFSSSESSNMSSDDDEPDYEKFYFDNNFHELGSDNVIFTSPLTHGVRLSSRDDNEFLSNDENTYDSVFSSANHYDLLDSRPISGNDIFKVPLKNHSTNQREPGISNASFKSGDEYDEGDVTTTYPGTSKTTTDLLALPTVKLPVIYTRSKSINDAYQDENIQIQGQGRQLTSSMRTHNKKRKGHDAKRVKALMGRFRHNYTHGYIDVWWLFDDGGLTILLPFILSQRKLWQNCEMRVFAITHDKKQLDIVYQSFISMLSKFRIDYSRVVVLPDINKLPYPTSTAIFEQIVEKFRVKDESDPKYEPGMITDEAWEANHLKTMRHIRLYEMLKQHSSDSNIIFITLPVPRKGSCPSTLYMSWLEMVTHGLNPPVFFLRGNQQSVLTFYS